MIAFLAHIKRARATLDEAAEKALLEAVVVAVGKRTLQHYDPNEYADLDRMIGPTV